MLAIHSLIFKITPPEIHKEAENVDTKITAINYLKILKEIRAESNICSGLSKNYHIQF